MRLISCHIRDFGVCHDLTLNFERGLQEFLQDNGWGKSTVITFLGVMLFGFANENARKDVALTNERERFRPWQGGSYGGSITFEEKGIVYTANKTFHENRKSDEYELREVNTNIICRTFPPEIGTAIWGIDRESFQLTNCISRNDCATAVTDTIRLKLVNPSAPQKENLRLNEAEEQLKDLRNAYSPDRKTGRLYRLRAEIEALKLAVEHPETAISSGQNDSLRLVMEQYRETELSEEDTEQMMELNTRFSGREPNVDELEDMLSLVQERRDMAAQANELDEEVHRLEEQHRDATAGWPDEDELPLRHNSKAGVVLFVFAVLMLFGGILLGLEVTPYGYGLAGIGLILLVIGIALQVRALKKEEQLLPADIEAEEMKKKLAGRIAKAKEAAARVKEADNTLAAFLRSYKITPQAGNEALQIMELRTDVKEYARLRQMATRHGKAKERLAGLREELTEQLRDKEETAQKLTVFYERIGKTAGYLREANLRMNSRYNEPVLTALKGYFALLGMDGLTLRMDAEMTLTVESAGVQRDIRTLSTGYQDLYGFCMRLALLDTIYPQDKPPLILDDPFAHLDAAGCEQAMKLLENLSTRYQILYFTCHDSRM